MRALQAQMDAILRRQGLTRGTVGERMTALTRDPRQLFPNTDAGRAQLPGIFNECQWIGHGRKPGLERLSGTDREGVDDKSQWTLGGVATCETQR